MFPDDEEKEDTTLSDFNEYASLVIEQTPDVDSGLNVLRQYYDELNQSSEGKYKTELGDALRSTSLQAYQKFDQRTKLSFDDTLVAAPIDLSEIEGVGATEREAELDKITKWGQENIKFLDESDDPFYVQNRDFYKDAINKASVAQQRAIRGTDNYWITDWALRAGQGVVGGIASLVGADGVNDWFEKQTNPEWDDSWGTAISSGIGAVGGAVGAGVVTAAGAAAVGVTAPISLPLIGGVAAGTLGATGYLVASGAGAAKEQYEDAIATGATEGEALAAAGIEAGSQLGQAVVGGKIFGKVVGKIVGSEVSGAANKIGAKVFTKLRDPLVEGTTEAAGQVFSNIATNIGQDENIPLLQGTGGAFAAGFIATGAAHGVGTLAAEVQARRERAAILAEQEASPFSYLPQDVILEDEATVPPPQDIAMVEETDPYTDLTNELDTVAGEAPPPSELIRKPSQALEDTGTEVLGDREDGTVIKYDADNVYIETGDGTVGEAYDSVFSITPETHAKLKELGISDYQQDNSFAPDGTNYTLVTEDGKLFIQSEYLSDDLQPLTQPRKDGVTRIEIPATEGILQGQMTVGVDAVKQNRHIDTEGVTRDAFTSRYTVIDSPVRTVDTSANAAKAGYNQKEHQTARRLRTEMGSTLSEYLGLSTTSYETDADGTQVEVEVPLATYFPLSRSTQLSETGKFMEGKDPLQLLFDLEQSTTGDRFTESVSARDVRVAAALAEGFRNGFQQARMSNDPVLANKFQDLATRATNIQVLKASTGGLVLESAKGPSAQVAVDAITTKLEADAAVVMQNELGVQPKDIPALEKAATDAENAYTKQLDTFVEELGTTEPVVTKDARDLVDTIVEDESITEQQLEDIDTEIQSHKVDIRQLEADIVEQTDSANRAKEQARERADELRTKIAELENTVEELPSLEVTKEQTTKQEGAQRRIDSAQNTIDELTPRIEALENKERTKGEDTELKNLKTRVEKANNRLQKGTNDLNTINSEIENRTGKKKTPTSKIVKDLERLRKQLTATEDAIASTEGLDLSQSEYVKNKKANIDERRRRIVDLTKKKDDVKTGKEKTPRQKQLQERKDKLLRNKEKLLTKEQQDALKAARKEASRLRNRANRAQAIIDEHTAKFPLKERQRLADLYDAVNNATSPMEKYALNKLIHDIELKYLPKDPKSIKSLQERAYASMLSGPATIINNLGSLANIPLATANFLMMDIARVGKGVAGSTSLQGFVPGTWNALMKRGIPQALAVLRGEMPGRSALYADVRFKPKVETTPNGTKVTYAKHVEGVEPLWVQSDGFTKHIPFLNLFNNISHAIERLNYRITSATDTLVFNLSKEAGQWETAAYAVINDPKIARKDRPQAIQNALFNTDTHIDEVNQQVRDIRQNITDLGGSLTSAEEATLFWDLMDQKRSQNIDVSDDFALTQTMMKPAEPTTVFGSVGYFINGGFKAIDKAGLKVFGRPFNPARLGIPFVTFATNLANMMTSYTPITAPFDYALSKQVPKFTEKTDPNTGKPIASPFNQTDQLLRERMGRLITGSAMMGITTYLLSEALDDDDPWITWTGSHGDNWQTLSEQGVPEYSLGIKAPWSNKYTYLTPNVLGPLTAVFSSADTAAKAINKGESVGSVVGRSILSVPHILSEHSVMKQLDAILSTFNGQIGDSDSLFDRATNAVYGLAANTLQPLIVPASSFWKNIYRWSDGSPRDTYNNFMGKLTNQLPVLTDMFSGVKYNRWGEQITPEGWLNNPLTSGLMKQAYNSDVDQWMQTTGYSMSRQQKGVRLTKEEAFRFGDGRPHGYRDILTTEEAKEMLLLTGPQLKEMFRTKYMHLQHYTDKAQQWMNEDVRKIRADARRYVIEKTAREMYGKKSTEE